MGGATRDVRFGPIAGRPAPSRVYTRFFLATLRDFFFVLAFLFGAERLLAAILLATFFLARGSRSGPFASKRIGSFSGPCLY